MAHFPIRGWQWIFYIYGWFTGALSLVFWAIMILLYFINGDKQFFGHRFHRRVFIWGVVMAILSILGILAALAFAVLVPLVAVQGAIASI